MMMASPAHISTSTKGLKNRSATTEEANRIYSHFNSHLDMHSHQKMGEFKEA